jgi:hypothetical protein
MKKLKKCHENFISSSSKIHRQSSENAKTCGKFFLFLDFMQINFENFKIFLIITRVKFLLGVEF